MSSTDSAARAPELAPGVETKKDQPREGWFDRMKVALGLKPAPSIRDDLEDALEEASTSDDDDFSVEEKRILKNLLAARDRRVQDVMVARGAIVGVSDTVTFAELREVFATAAHSRIPVYGETLDDPKGMIHLRDVYARLDAIAPETSVAQTGLVRPVLFAPGTMPALDLLLDMQAQRIHMALVIDEYGATDGLVSLEDLIEIIVGEIEDEHDVTEDPQVEALAKGAIGINGFASLTLVNELLGVELDRPSEDHDIETIGGYVTAMLGRVPVRGEKIEDPNGLVFTVIDGDKRRIRRLRIARAERDLPAN
jgi:CBS domain containing-hemolysin-like protein